MTTWRKPSRSGTGTAGRHECVEVASLSGSISVRDSKHPEHGHLAVISEAFASLTDQLRRDN